MSETSSRGTALEAASPATLGSLARVGNSMDFTPIPHSKKPRTLKRAFSWLGSGLGALGLAQFPVVTVATMAASSSVMLVSLLVAGGSGIAMFLSLVNSDIQRGRIVELRAERIRAELNEHYGIRLTARDLADLRYPEAKPSSDFEVFGSMLQRERVSESSFVELKIYLVWMDGRFQLSKSKDGKSFKELKPARQELAAASQKSALSERPAPLALPA
jgi:hypothetical protein